MKKVFFSSPKEKFDYKNYISGKTLYILPSEIAINYKIKSEVFSGINIINTKFITFDNLIKFKNIKRPDNILKFIVLKMILNRNFPDKEIFDESVEIIVDFFDELINSGKRKKDILKFTSPIIKSLADSFGDYLIYFSKNSYTLDSGLSKISEDDIRAETIIIDGFIDFGYFEFDFIERISKSKNIIINIPFNIENNITSQSAVAKLENMNFEIVKSNTECINDLLANIPVDLYDASDDYYNMFFVELKKDIINQIKDIDIITGSSSLAKSINNRSVFQDIEFNLDLIERSLIKEEIITVLDYLEDKNRHNTLKRIRLSYFNLPVDKNMLEEDLLKQNFKNIADFNLQEIKELDIKQSHLQNFLDGVKFLQQENIKNTGSLEYFCEYFIEYMNNLENIIKKRFNPKIYDFVYVRDMNFLNKVIDILNKMPKYRIFYKSITFKEFKCLFKKYIKNIKFKLLQNRDAITMKNLQSMYYKNFGKLYIIGFDANYERISQKNFIYTKKTIEELEEFKIRGNDSEIELMELVYAITNSQKTTILINDEDKGLAKNINILKKICNLDISTYIKKYYSSEIEIFNNRDKLDYKLSSKALNNLNLRLKDRTYSVTDFDVLSDCPRRFLFERIFKLEEFALDYDDKFYLKMGDRFHNILKRYFKLEKSILDEALLKKLVLQENFKDKTFDDLKFLEQVQVLNDFNFLKDYIIIDLENQKEDFLTPKYFEKRIDLDIEGIKIVGRIDRIDSNGDEEAIMDYKRSKSSIISKNKILENKAFQMPIYALSRLKDNKNIVKLIYGSIQDAEIKTVMKNSDLRDKLPRVRYFYSDEELKEIFKSSKNAIISLVESLKQGNMDSESDCLNCIYKDICENK
ncbi:RecB family exonuclease [Peptoniphilus olsenii]|uniref:RecB family exonuclease n=1 Tax=Peptoniphilus olsenii TaxID=411570 RepID=A0ABV2JAJ8_9FIRM